MALGLSTSTFLFDNGDRYHGVVLTVEVPQFQFIDSVEDILVWQQRQVPWLRSPVEVPQILVINSVEDTPAVCFHSRIYPGLTLYGEGVSAPFKEAGQWPRTRRPPNESTASPVASARSHGPHGPQLPLHRTTTSQSPVWGKSLAVVASSVRKREVHIESVQHSRTSTAPHLTDMRSREHRQRGTSAVPHSRTQREMRVFTQLHTYTL